MPPPAGTIGSTISLGSHKNSTSLIDIGTGAASSEVVLIPNMLHDSTSRRGKSNYFECDISSGTRLAYRAETNTASVNHDCIVIISDTRFPELSTYTYTDYGANAGSAGKGTDIDPGLTADTKGSYVEMTASSASDIQALMLIIGANGNSSLTTGTWLFDIATGAASSETDIISNIFIGANASKDHVGGSYVFPGEDFQSARISLRAQSSITNPDRILTAMLIAIRGNVPTPSGGRIMSSLAGAGGLAGPGGIAGPGGGLAG